MGREVPGHEVPGRAGGDDPKGGDAEAAEAVDEFIKSHYVGPLPPLSVGVEPGVGPG